MCTTSPSSCVCVCFCGYALEMHTQILICVGKFWRRGGSTLLTSLSPRLVSLNVFFLLYNSVLSFVCNSRVVCKSRVSFVCDWERVRVYFCCGFVGKFLVGFWEIVFFFFFFCYFFGLEMCESWFLWGLRFFWRGSRGEEEERWRLRRSRQRRGPEGHATYGEWKWRCHPLRTPETLVPYGDHGRAAAPWNVCLLLLPHLDLGQPLPPSSSNLPSRLIACTEGRGALRICLLRVTSLIPPP